MKLTSFFKTFSFVLIAMLALSCDKEFNEIGTDFVDNDHYSFETIKYDVKAINQPLGPVQTNNLPLNSIGFLKNNVFGNTNASFVTQLELDQTPLKIINNSATLRIDSVYLHVPYFSRLESTDENGDRTFSLDSVYGSGKIKLDVYRSNYYLRNLDPNPIGGGIEQQNYFSSERSDVESNLFSPTRLNNDLSKPYQNDEFEFRNSEIKFLKTDASGNIITPNVVRERLLPGIYMDLDIAAFRTAIASAGDANLADNNVFKNHFRGLYFKATALGSNPGGAMAALNFAQGKIVMVYYDAKSSTDPTVVRKTITLNLKGYTANYFDYTPTGTAENANYTTAVNNPNTTAGDSRLYVKGGAGSMAVIDLFRGLRSGQATDPADTNYENPLYKMHNEGWLINEANLTFYLDNDIMGTTDPSQEPNRVYLYDFNNKRPLVDYSFDTSTNSDTKFNKLIYSGIVNKVSSTSRGTKYKVRITNHMRNLVKYQDSTNVKLGLVVTENINSTPNYKLKNPFNYYVTNSAGIPVLKSAKYVPAMSIMNPLGVALYGSNIPSSDVNYGKRLQLEVVYTKPD